MIDQAVIEDTGSTILIADGRPEPPPAVAIGAIYIPIYIRSLGNGIVCRHALSCTVGREILFRFFDAEQEHFVVRCLAGRCVIIGILVGRNGYIFYEVRRWFKLLFGGGVKRSVNELRLNSSATNEEQTETKEMLSKLEIDY